MMICSTAKDWSKEVRKAMIDREITQKDLAEKFRYSYQMVNRVVNGDTSSERLTKLISDFLEVKLDERGWNESEI